MTPSFRRPFAKLAVASITLLLSSLAWTGCSDQAADSPTAPGDPEALEARATPPVNLPQQSFAAAVAAQNRYGQSLMATPGVVGHGIGLVDGEPGIRVFLLTPDVQGIPERLDDVPVGRVVTGMFRAGADPTSRARPAPNGFSLGHPDITAGTLGAIVQGNTDGICYALSNNHVLANVNQASIGDHALQPGPYDGGLDPADAIGALADFEPLDFQSSTNRIDAAVAELFDPVTDFVTGQTPAYGAPGTGTQAASVGMKVKKYGRTTGLTTGEVTETNVTVSVCYECSGPFCFRCKAAVTFEDQIGTTDMSDGGDSGSLVVTDDNANSPVGLLYAGSSTRTLANPIDEVFSRFDVSIPTDLSTCTNGGGVPPSNLQPTAAFTYTMDGLKVDFTDTSSDRDGSIVGWEWDFGDGNTSTSQNPSNTYSSGGTYSVTLQVTDDGGGSGSSSQDVTVSEPTSGGISLSALGYKDRGLQKTDLTWAGANSTNVDVYRDGGLIAAGTPNDGTYTDPINERGSATYTYEVCEAGTSTCSNTVTVIF